MHAHEFRQEQSRGRTIVGIVAAVLAAALILCSVAWYLYQLPYTPPGIVPLETYVEIPSGSSARSVGTLLEEEGVIRNAEIFLVALEAQGRAEQIKSGTYFFTRPESLSTVINRVTTARYDLPTTRMTFLEGQANYQYAAQLAQEFEFVSESSFRTLAKPYEGYLFPDTYFIPRRSTAREIIDIMRSNFEQQTKSLQSEVAKSPYSLDEIITMASLVESEAGSADLETKRRVAGILWERVERGMPLQADAVFSYIYQSHLPRVLYRHLEVDSPYNVYKNTGLPPGPIGNPGLDSIKAALNPIESDSLYYLTGHDGQFYYAQTLAQHERNRRNYLQY